MNNHQILASVMRKEIFNAGLSECSANGDFSLSTKSPVLFPGAVYGFAVCLTEQEKCSLFEEAASRGLSKLKTANDLKPICGSFYPIYWGKDKQIGARPYLHLNDPKGNGVIRLSTYKTLNGKTISCAVVVVDDYMQAEMVLQRQFLDLLKTSTTQQTI